MSFPRKQNCSRKQEKTHLQIWLVQDANEIYQEQAPHQIARLLEGSRMCFICEDLTPMRSRLVWFIKNNHSDKFCNVHTMNGVIRMKKKGTDAETADSNWLSVSNVDDFYKLLDREEDFDIVEFNKGLHGFKILPQLAINPINFELDGLVESEEEYSE